MEWFGFWIFVAVVWILDEPNNIFICKCKSHKGDTDE